MVWTPPDLLPSLFARIAEHRKVKFVRGTRLKRSEIAEAVSAQGGIGTMVSSIANVYATAFSEYGKAMIPEVLELLVSADSTMEMEAAEWAQRHLEENLDATVAAIFAEVQESEHAGELSKLTEIRITQILAELKRDLQIACDKAVLKGSSRTRSAPTIPDLAMMDTLVPLRNRRAYDVDLPTIVNAATTAAPCALLAFDVDKFKSVNDEHGGHATGDEALKGVAAIADACIRGKGTAYRLSGDEFRIVLPNHTPEEAIAVAERVRRTIYETPLTSQKLTLSISVGVAFAPRSGTELAVLDKAADEAAYDAKEFGRNQVRVYGEPRDATPSQEVFGNERTAASGSGNAEEHAARAARLPVVAVYDHVKAFDSPVLPRVIELFRETGWHVETPGTSVPRHEQGIWIHGGTELERATALLALRGLGIAPRIDDTDDNPPCLQIIVGKTERTEERAVSPFAHAEGRVRPSNAGTANTLLNRPTDLRGELDVRLHLDGIGVGLQVKNINPAGPKKDIQAFLDDLKKWAPEVSTFVEIAEFARSPKPLQLILRGGTPEIFYGQKQFYSLIPEVDRNNSVRVPYRREKTVEQIRIRKGLWLCRIRVTWNDRAQVEEYFVRFERPHTAPEIAPDPREQSR